MEPIRLGPFLGASRAPNPKLLSVPVGTNSLNQWPDRGDLRPWKVPLTVATTAAGIKTIFMLGRDTVADSIVWFAWTTVVHAVRSFLSDDTTKRTYYTGSGAPKVTDNLIGIAGAPYPTSYRDLGIPKPASLPTVTQSAAGTGSDETRFYAFAYVSDWDEIGMPVVVGPITCKPGATFNITNMPAAPTGAGQTRGINRMRVWRTVASTSADFFFLRDEPLPATTTTDDARAVGSDKLASQTWAMPPSDLKNLIGLWNGMMAGISGKAVRYCELFRPYAWPSAYETLCIDTPIALGVWEQNLLILTTGKPRLVNGSAPEAMNDAPIELHAGCVSPQSVVSMGHGVCWACADGLAYVGNNGVPRILTKGCMLVDDWRALVPSSIVGSYYQGRYFGFYNDGGGLKGFVVDPDNPDGIYFLETGYTTGYFDALGEEMHVLDGTNIRRWHAGASNMTATFRSKVFRMPRAENPGVAEVIADAFPVTFKLWAGSYDGTGWLPGDLKMTKTVTSRDTFYLPAGYLADDIQIEVSTSAGGIAGVAIGSSVADLMSV